MTGFENPLMLALVVLVAPAIYVVWKGDERFNKMIGVSRSLVLLLIVLAAATPYIHAETDLMEEPEITVLKDNSKSTEVVNDVEYDFEEIKVNEKVIASGNSSNLRKGIMRNLEPNRAYLLESDVQSSTSLEGMADEFQQRNSTLHLMKGDTEEEVSVKIEGPDTTVPGAENRFHIKVHSTGEAPEPEVTMNGNSVSLTKTGNNTWSFTRSFTDQGSHTIQASVDVNDEFSINNQYYKAVEVTEKPKILVIGESDSFDRELSKFYDLEYRHRLPDDLEPYYSIILTESVEDEQLTEYVVEGNGVVYTGDPEEDTMDILPVKKVDREEQTDAAKLLLVIDISFSRSECDNDGVICGPDDAAEITRSTAIAHNLVERLPYNNKVGILPYNTEAYQDSEATEPVPLADNRNMLTDKIASLQPGGNSFHHVGLEGAEKILDGNGNIVLISDGKITDYGRNVDTERKSKDIASNLGDIQLITVGVGEDRNEDFLKDLANRGNGQYLDAEDSNRLQFRFAAGGAEGRTASLVIVNPDHFITDGLELSSTADKFDTVEPRQGADLLATSTDGKPALTTWRYGLGRVAAFSADDNYLSNIAYSDPLLASRAVSWTVGDPKRKQDEWLQVKSARMPQTVKAEASYSIQGFSRQGDDLYTRELRPEETGFHSVEDQIYAYNYPGELEEIGHNEDAREIVRKTGGQVYTPDEKDQIRQDIKSFSNKKTVTKQPLSSYLLLAAMILFLIEVGYRKVKGKK